MSEKMRLKLHGLSDVGLGKQVNEDSFSACADLDAEVWGSGFEETKLGHHGAMVLIADGMGPDGKGELASDIFIDEFKEHLKSLNAWPESDPGKLEMLKEGMLHTHEIIKEKAETDHLHNGLGASALVAWINEQKLYLAWVGDSRAYLLRDQGELVRLTDDHTIAWNLFKKGEINEEEARTHPQANALTQYLGDSSTQPEPDGIIFDLSRGDRLLFCTDGLIKELNSKQLLNAIVNAEDPASGCLNLIKQASKGSKDNLTAVITDITAGPVAELATNKTEAPAHLRKEKMLNPFLFVGACLLAALIIWFILPKGAELTDGNQALTDSVNLDLQVDTNTAPIELDTQLVQPPVPVESELDSATEVRIKAFNELDRSLDQEIQKLEDQALLRRMALQIQNPEGKDPYLIQELGKLKENISSLLDDLNSESSPVQGAEQTALNNFKIRLASLQSSTKQALEIVKLLEEDPAAVQ